MSRRLLLPVIALAALTLSACSGTAEPASTATTDAAATGFPRTIEVPAGKTTSAVELTIEEQPERIATLSYETTALAVELGLADKLVMIPEQSKNPALTDHAEDLEGIDATIPTVSEFDPELVIAQQPDLVMLTARHGVEDGAGAALTAAGIDVLILPHTWSSTADITADITLVGAATGTEDAASALTGALTDGLTAAEDTDARVLVLNNSAGRPMVTAGSAFPIGMITLAGASDASADLGITATGPITAEQVVQAAPDAILLIDMNGSGEASFSSLLKNPAIASLPAVADGNVQVVSGKSVQALGLSSTIAGLADLKAWVAAL